MDEFWNAPRQGYTGPRYAESQRIAEANLNRFIILFGEFHQFSGKWQHETFVISPCYVLEVAAWNHATVQSGPGDIEISVHCLFPGLSQLQEYMIIARRGQDACFGQSHLRDQLKIRRHSPDPAGNFRIFIIPLFAEFDRFSVAL